MSLPVTLIGEERTALEALRDHLHRSRGEFVSETVLSLGEARSVRKRFGSEALVVLDVSHETERAFHLAKDLKAEQPELRLLVTATNDDPNTILRALRSGAEEFVRQPIAGAELLESLQRMKRKAIASRHNGAPHGHLVTVFSPQGGAGCTTVATNLAVTLAASHHRVCIIDLAFQFGAVTSFLDVEAAYTIADLAGNLGGVDGMTVDGALARHGSGVRVLAEPAHPELANRITADEVSRILECLTKTFDIVIADMPKELDESRLPALRAADLNLLVAEFNVPSVKRCHRALAFLATQGVRPETVRLVENRQARKRSMTHESVEGALRQPVFWSIPDDPETAASAANQGVPASLLKPGSGIALGHRELADRALQELGLGCRPDEGRKRSALGQWLGRAISLTRAPAV